MKKRSIMSGIIVGVLASTITAQAFVPFPNIDIPDLDFPPFLSLVTAVPATTSDTTPSFTFSSTEDGTITYMGDCSSSTTAAVAGNNTITFNELSVGTHSNCKVVVTDSAANVSGPLDVPSFDIVLLIDPSLFDLVAPTLSLVEGVDTPTTDTTPSFTFLSSEAGTIYYTGLCTSSKTTAVAGNNTVTMSELGLGTYDMCSVRVVDDWGNVSAALNIPTFKVLELPPAVATCAGFTDVDTSDSSCDAVTYVKSIGAMTGNPDGSFEPDSLLQRDQVAKIVLETFGLFNSASDYCDGISPFGDIQPAAWSYQYICRAKVLKLVTGYATGVDAGMYRPSRSISRSEALAIILRNLSGVPDKGVSSYSDVDPDAWFAGYAKYAKDNSLYTGSKLNPDEKVSREEMAELIYKLHKLGEI